jgi:hypothetical protein
MKEEQTSAAEAAVRIAGKRVVETELAVAVGD